VALTRLHFVRCATAAAILLAVALPRAFAQGTVDHELSAVREGLKAQSELVSQDEKKAAELLSEIRSIDSRLLNSARTLESLQIEEAELEEDFEEAKLRLERVERERASLEAILSERLSSIYKRGRLGSNRAFVQAAASSEPLRMARYLAAVSQSDSRSLRSYDEVRQEQEEAVAEISQKKQEIAAKKSDLESESENYEKTRGQKGSLLASIEKDLAVHRATRERLSAVEDELQQIMKPVEPEKDARPARLARLHRSKAGPFGGRKGRLVAPLAGDVLVEYGERGEQGRRVQGLVVQAAEDKRIVTVGEGEVVFAGPFPGLGNTIIVNHGDRFHTVYARLASINLEVGERVQPYEVVGSLDGRDPKLHFELRNEGKPIDPLPWFEGGESAFAR
jgi:septal ring factor EnvC (AmiA/AmiB activator)